MNIEFKYSLLQDYLRGLDTFTRRRSYLNIRSVVRFSFFLPIKTFFKRKKLIHNLVSLWDAVESDVIKRLKDEDVEVSNDPISVYIVTMGVEGKYNEFKRRIWARYYKCGGEIEFIKTIIHELVHIYYADKGKLYRNIEDEIDSIVEKIQVDTLISKKYLEKYGIGQDEMASNQLR